MPLAQLYRIVDYFEVGFKALCSFRPVILDAKIIFPVKQHYTKIELGWETL